MKIKRIGAFLALAPALLTATAFADYSNQRSDGTQPSTQTQIQTQRPPPQYQGNYGPPPVYSAYPGYGGYGGYGGYLPPGPVNPGQDEADRIYEENQHPPR